MESSVKKGLFLYWTFFKGMLFAFTGGMAAIPVVRKAVVDQKHWMTEEEFWTYPALAQGLPGVICLHYSLMIGNRIAGPFGAFMAVTGTVTPAFFFMLIIAALFQTLVDNSYVQGMIRGIRTIAIAIILGNAVRMLKTTPKDLFSFILVLAGLTVPLFFGASAFWTIITCGVIGILSVFIRPGTGKSSGTEAEK